MMRFLAPGIVLAFHLLPSSGCVVEDTLAMHRQDVASENKLSLNKLSLNKLSLNKLSLGSLSADRFVLDADGVGELATTEDGRELLAYVARCALPEGEELVLLGNDGKTLLYSFPGSIGLAPQWATSLPSGSMLRWVSACLLAHVNYYGVSVPISLRGQHPALATTLVEQQEYSTQEGAFYGNVFADRDSDGSADLVMYACHGKAASESSDYLLERVCSEPSGLDDGRTVCGFVDMGACHTMDVASQPCSRHSVDGEVFYPCTTSTTDTQCNKRKGSAESFDEVITVYVPNA